MMKLISHNNEILKKSMPNFDFENPIMDPQDLEKQLISTMTSSNGIGLSAPQVGLETRVFAIYCKNLYGITTPFAAFNPNIIATSEEQESSEEGCLSFPGLVFHVKRPKKILVEFFDKNKNKLTITLEGIDARCFQHEYDHLNGICFTDKISKFKLDRALSKQRKKNGRTK